MSDGCPTVMQIAERRHVADGAVTVCAAGDVCLGGLAREVIAAKGENFIFSRVQSLIEKPSVFIVNLECSFSEDPPSEDYVRAMRERTKDRIFFAQMKGLRSLVDGRVSAVSLANNHVMDLGEAGLKKTIDALDTLGIGHSGAGMDAEDAARALVLTGPLAVVVLSYFGTANGARERLAGHNSGGLAKIVQDVRAHAGTGRVVIVTLHWGVPLGRRPMVHQVAQARAIIDAGAVAVLGTGPHVLQPVERYHGGVIAYSLGDFVFHHQGESRKSMVLVFRATDRGVEEVRILPVLISERCEPVPLDRNVDPNLYEEIEGLLLDRVVDLASDDELEKCLFDQGEFDLREALTKGLRNFGSYPPLYYLVGAKLLLRKTLRRLLRRAS